MSPPAPPPPTWVFPSSAPLDETHNQQDENEKSHRAHDPNEPALCGDVHLVLSIDCTNIDTHVTSVTKQNFPTCAMGISSGRSIAGEESPWERLWR